MPGWMAEMADVVDAAQTGAPAPPVTKAAPPAPTVVPSSIEDTPTEPATSPRMIDPEAREWAVELQLPTREIGPREEPERYATRFIVNDGQWTPEEHENELYKAAQAGHCKQWNREAREAAERQYKEFNRNMEEWKAQVESRGFKDHPAMPHGPRRLHPCKLFQTFTMLSDRMILPGLLRRSRSSRRPLQQQADPGQQLSIQEMNLRRLVQHQCSLHHHQSH